MLFVHIFKFAARSLYNNMPIAENYLDDKNLIAEKLFFSKCYGRELQNIEGDLQNPGSFPGAKHARRGTMIFEPHDDRRQRSQ